MPARLGLSVLSVPYSAVVCLRNRLYTSGRLSAHKANVPVISVGNLTTGGTGKTPLVVWLCRYVREKGLHCAILTRGYKTRRGELSDEPALLAADCPQAVVIVNPDRVAGAAEAIHHHGVQVLIMDDGFQHRRLARDLDIVSIDATQPFGYGRVLPAGLLREPVSGLRRAHAAVLTRCDQTSEDAVRRIEDRVLRVNPGLVVARSVHAPTVVKTADGTEFASEEVRDRRVFAFSGLGNPRAFFRTLEQLGTVLTGSRSFDDHYRYTLDDVAAIREQAGTAEAELILTTQKDWMKIEPLSVAPEGPLLGYLAIELRITAGEAQLKALIDDALAGTMLRL